MLINKVCSMTRLTKKAISYYEKHKLINPRKNINGYREYSKEDIDLLNEISLYRKLNISINDIKKIIKSNDKKSFINKIIQEKNKEEINLRVQKNYLERIINNNLSNDLIRELNEEILDIEKNEGVFIKRELVRVFPSGLGKYLSYHFSTYLNEPLNTVEKYNAWLEIVEFLDNFPEIKIPKEIEVIYENVADKMHEQINDSLKDEMNKMLNSTDDEIKEYKKNILDQIEKQNDEALLEVMKPINDFKKQINELFNSCGYYDVFIPNMKILSNDYKKYHDDIIMLNEKLSNKLGIKYDENMNLIVK